MRFLLGTNWIVINYIKENGLKVCDDGIEYSYYVSGLYASSCFYLNYTTF
jgi:hypothetical protein